MSDKPNSLTNAKLSLLDRVHSTVSLGIPTPNFLISQKEYLALKDELSNLRKRLAKCVSAADVLCAACEADFGYNEDAFLDSEKVSYPEEREHITFGMIRNLRAAIAASQKDGTA